MKWIAKPTNNEYRKHTTLQVHHKQTNQQEQIGFLPLLNEEDE